MAALPVNVMLPLVRVTVRERVPEDEKFPVDKLFAPKASVPAPSVKVRVDPRVKFAPSVRVLALLFVTGKSKVFPKESSVKLPNKVKVPLPDPSVIPLDSVKAPERMVSATLDHVPAKPVKSNAPMELLAVNVTVSVPPVMLTGFVKFPVVLNVRVPVPPA